MFYKTLAVQIHTFTFSKKTKHNYSQLLNFLRFIFLKLCTCKSSLLFLFEPLTRVELVTPSLPRKCSTTELQRHLFSKKNERKECFSPPSVSSVAFSSGRRGSNPPPIAWKAIALPNELLPQVVWGRVDSNHRTLPRTDLQSVAIAAMRLPHCLSNLLKLASRWRDSNPRPRDYKSRALAN